MQLEAKLRGFPGFIAALERRGSSPWTPVAVAFWIAGLRVLEEYLLVNIPRGVRRNPLPWVAHVELFYIALLFCISGWVHWVTKREARKVIPVVAAGLILGIMPPLIDAMVYPPGGFSYAYRFGFLSGFRWLLYDPPLVTPIGETVTVWSSIALVMIYVRTIGTSWRRVLLVGVGHYALIVSFLALIPSSSVWMSQRLKYVDGNLAVGVLLFGAALTGYFMLRPRVLLHTLERLPHILFAPVLVVLGAAMMGRNDSSTLAAALIMTAAAALFALHNNFYDRREDGLQGRARIINEWDVVVLSTLVASLLLLTLTAFFWPTLMAVLFLVVAHGYHADPFRLKCIFPLSYKSEAFFAFLCITAGVLAAPGAHPERIHVVAMFVAGAGGSIVALLKDYKDVEADRGANVRTIYVVLMERGWSELRVFTLVAMLVGGALALPCAWLLHRGQSTTALACAALTAASVMLPRSVPNRKLGTAGALICLVSGLGVFAWGLLPTGL